MENFTCYIDPYSDKQMLRNNFSNEEYWVSSEELPVYMHGLCEQTGFKKIFIEGSYFESLELIYKFKTMYQNSDIVLEAI